MSLDSQIIYKQLFQRHRQIRIPMIQRDYAQGRPAETEIREEFLNALWEALLKPMSDPTLPLNLDFIYGSVEGEGETRFLPLDGQQRLTTLFLLHWYLAWRDEQWEVFEQLFQAERHSRFVYSVRPSSNDFFDALVSYRPADCPDAVGNLKRLICDQPWYFRSWRLDPTIQSVLCMFDAIHKRFAATKGLFSRLINEDQPAITFQLLHLENFGLSDDLYIKMNARGKPLTEFENFKARYEQELEKQFEGNLFRIGEQSFSAAQYVALRMDTVWIDLVWRLRDKKSNLYDGALMNIFRAVALVTRSPDNSEFLNDISLLMLRNGQKAPSYTDFHSRGWLDEHFTLTIIYLLNAWSKESGKFATLLPDPTYFDERAIFNKIVSNGANLSYVELVQFAAYVGFIARHQEAIDPTTFQEWMRIIYNLSENSDYNRLDDLRRSFVGLNTLLEYSEDVLKHFAESKNPGSGFSPQQITEEKLKAELILAGQNWRGLIDRAEKHGYFRGQIGFLLDFSGASAARSASAPASWDVAFNAEVEQSYLNYHLLAVRMFTGIGLKDLDGYLWQRALLSIGDYTLPSSRGNYSFLVNGKDEQASWKRLLRGTGEAANAREVLHQLWDHLDSHESLEPQLERIIREAADVTPWRAELARTPQAIGYCENQAIRWYSSFKIYLLSKTQMNGAHAELFTLCLYYNLLMEADKVGKLRPLKLDAYYTPIGTDVEPGIRLAFRHREHSIYFDIEFHEGQFKLFAYRQDLEKWPDLLSLLIEIHFSESLGCVAKRISSEDIEAELIKLANYLTVVFPSSSDPI